MQDAKLTDAPALAAKAGEDGGGAAAEEGGLVDGFEPVAVALGVLLADLEIDGLAVSESLLAGQEGGAQHQHDAVEQAVDLLEARRAAAPGGREVALVAGLALLGLVLEDDVGRLEDLDGQAVRLVLTDRLEETGEKRGPDNLVLLRLGVGQSDGGLAVVFTVQPGKVLIVTVPCR